MIKGSKIIVNKTVFRVQGDCTKIIAESGQTGEYIAPFNGIEHYVMLGKQVLTLRDGEFDNYKEFNFEITEEDEKAWGATAGLSVIHPKHYKSNNDVIQFCLDNDMGFVEGNVLKYNSDESQNATCGFGHGQFKDYCLCHNKPSEQCCLPDGSACFRY